MVVKEAMACNLPIASLDVGDVAELTAGACHCEVVPARDGALGAEAALAAAAIRILESGHRSNGRDLVAHLSHETIARRVLDVYHRAASSATQTGRLRGRDAAMPRAHR